VAFYVFILYFGHLLGKMLSVDFASKSCYCCQTDTADEKQDKVRPLNDEVCALCFHCCFDTDGRVKTRTSSPCHLSIPKGSLLVQMEEEN